MALILKPCVVEECDGSPKAMAVDWGHYFEYQSNGTLIWKKRPLSDFASARAWKVESVRRVGKVAGYKTKDGYRLVRVSGISTFSHRIIWEMHHGPIPDGMQVDHKDGNKNDSRIENLRICSDLQNRWNTLARKKNIHKLKGVVFFKRDAVWVAQITASHKRYCIGRFQTKGFAAVAYAKASLKYHGKFSPYYKPQPSC